MSTIANAMHSDAIGTGQHSITQGLETVSRTNEHGIIVPDGTESFASPSGKATAEIKFAELSSGWIAEYSFRLRCGSFQASTLPLSEFSMPYRNLRDALADAAERMLADVYSKFRSTDTLPKIQKAEFGKLIEWAKSLMTLPPNSPKPKRKLDGKKFVDLFAGIGGFHEALKQQGATCVAAVELDAKAREVYQENHGKPSLMYTDIRDVNPDDLPEFDILTGGFPCQSFSIAGNRMGYTDPEKGALFFEILRIAKACKPSMLLLENVEGFATHEHGKTADIALEEMNNIGYATSMQVLTASEFGVPQQRKRIFIVGIRLDRFKEMRYPIIFPTGTVPTRVVADILEPNITAGRCKHPMTPVKMSNSQPSGIIHAGRLNNKRSQSHRVMSPHGQGVTLCTNQTGIYLVDGHHRYLTPRECARMQGFPDDFKVHSSASQARKQFGNAVVVPVVSAVSDTVRHFL